MTSHPFPDAASTTASCSTSLETQVAQGPHFIDLGLCAEILDALNTAGYTTPTPVQQRAIPAALAGRDLLVSSPTGSGKTAAFILPAIQRFAQIQSSSATANSERTRTMRRAQVARPALLVLTPTRELALQVTQAAETYGKRLGRLRTVSVLGGVPYRKQLELLARQPDIIVATPGRLLDHLERDRIDLSALSMLVLDEADRMLDMGFIDAIKTIVAATPSSRQTLLFSATLDARIGALTQRLLKSPERIEIAHRPEQRGKIEQSIHWVDDRAHKDRLLTHLLADTLLDQAIVFTATKSSADELSNLLSDAGFISAALHGDLPQSARNRTLRALRERRVRVLVATDVAARGIDVPGITHVFNYDLPKFAEDYVHRIGRTGRAGRSGTAISLAHPAEMSIVRRIERLTQQTLPVRIIEGFEPRRALTAHAPRKTNAYRPGFGSRAGAGAARGTQTKRWESRTTARQPIRGHHTSGRHR